MGLAVGVGVLADLLEHDEEGAGWLRAQIEKLNRVLAKRGLPPHQEPEALPPLEQRSLGSIPYSFLHALRRAYACMRQGEPLRTGELTAEDEDFVLDVAVTFMDSHLLSHSDAEGFYVPVDFEDPLGDDSLPGGFAGSTPRLLAELVAVAPLLGIRLQGAQLAPGEAERLSAVEEHTSPLWQELIAWWTLFEAAQLSLAHRTLIVFH